ncbi:MAG: hypothetical protein Fur009_3570 [Candidatus Microgenomates bacterium]
MILAKKLLIKKSFLDIPICLFLISQILSTIFSIDIYTSLFGYYGRFNGGLISIISYIFLYYAFISNDINPLVILNTSLLSSLIVILYAIPGKLGHDLTCVLASNGKIFDNSCWDNSILQFQPDVRAFSTLGQPNWFGAYLVINFFIGGYFLIYQISNIKNQKYISNIKYYFYLIYLFLNFSFILFTRSRSAFVAVFFGLIFLVIYYFILFKKETKKIIIYFFIITILPILLFKTGIDRIDDYITNIKYQISNIKYSYQKSNIIKKENSKSINIQNTLNITDSADIRKIVWQGAIKLGLQYPLFGTGVETFAYSYNFTRPLAHNYVSEWDFVYNKAHNEFLNYLATTGFIGLVTYLILIFSFYLFVFRKINKNFEYNLVVLYLMVAYTSILITNFFGFSTTTINLFFYLIPAFIVNLIKNKNDSSSDDDFSQINFDQIFLIFLILSISIYLLISIYKYYLADTYYALGNGYTKVSNPDYQKAAYFFDKALSLRNEHIYQDKLSFALAYLSAIAGLQKQDKIASDLIKVSEYYNNQSLIQSSKNIFYLKTKAKNQYYYFQATGNQDFLFKGIKILQESKKLTPTDPKISYTLSLYYSLLYDATSDVKLKDQYKIKAIEEINNCLNLKKDYSDAILLKEELKKKFKI